MPSSYSANLRLQLMATGEDRATWGVKANEVFNDLDAAVAGRTTVNMASDANYTLTAVNGSPDEARYMGLNITSVGLTATRSIIVPSVSKFYVIKNSTTGGQLINVRTATNTTQALIANSSTAIVWCDGAVCTTQIMPDYAGYNANIFYDTQSIVAGNATTLKNFLQLSPSDLGTGKPALVFQKTATSAIWNIALNDGTNNTGTINISASIVQANGLPVVTTTSTSTLTNKTLTTPAINGAAITGTWSGNATFSGTLTLTRPTITLQDSTTTFQDNADNTKQFQFQASGITTATTRTYTVPNYDATFATLAGTETLTNKTLTSPTLNSPTINSAAVNATSLQVGGLDVSGWLKISTTSLTGAFVNIPVPSSGYSMFKFVIVNAASNVAANTDTMSLYMSADGGATFYSSSGDYVTTANTNVASIMTTEITGGTPPLKGGYTEFNLSGTPVGEYASVRPIGEFWRLGGALNVGGFTSQNRVMLYNTAMNYVRLQCASGSLTQGSVIIYGLKT